MSFFRGQDPEPGNAVQSEAIAQVIVPRSVDLGDFTVHRALPSGQSRMVGPFIFFDHFGPAHFRSGAGIDVRPHPHIGLATLTYLFDGEIVHRDSLGTAIAIRPGEINWMTAGRGIVHSERTGPERRASGDDLHGLQCWVALPAATEETAPAFAHHGVEEFPVVRDGAGHEERAIYVIDGEIDIGGDRFERDRLLVFRPGDPVTLRAVTDTHLMILGGAAMDGPRHIWWNFVSSRKERIEQAKAEWAAGHFGKVPGDEIEFIPLPEK